MHNDEGVYVKESKHIVCM